MIKLFFKGLINSGTSFATTIQEKQNILISNYVALILVGEDLFVLIYRTSVGSMSFGLVGLLLIQMGLFIVPLLINKVGYLRFGRILLSWIPSLFTMFNVMYVISAAPESSTYVGFRFFLIMMACIPFMIFSLSSWFLLILGLSVPIGCLLFFDPILDLFGFGYTHMGLHEHSYAINTFRSMVSYAILGLSFIFLKKTIEESQETNQQLLNELEQKNKLILQRAAHEVSELDNKLFEKVEELKERDFVLSESQRIAKIGSWRYTEQDSLIFWSDEMYSILEVEKDYKLTLDNISRLYGSQFNNPFWAAHNKLNIEGKAVDTTIQIDTSAGQKWIRLIGSPQYLDGRISGSIGICHDITSYKEAEEKIIINEKKYRSLFEQASDAIMITDLKGNFMDVNSSMCTTLGYQKEELLQMNIAHLIDSEQLKANPIKFKELSEGKQVVNERLMLHKSGNLIPVESNVKKFGEGSLLAILRNISERKETAQKLKKYIHELALLNTINTISAKASDATALLKRLCEVLLSQGEYKLAWIGQEYFSSTEHSVRPFISLGDSTGYLKDLIIDLRNSDHREGPTAQALLTGETRVINKIQNDPTYQAWRSNALKHGFQSSLALRVNIEPFERYVLNIYSSKPDSFDLNEASTIERIAENIATAIKSIHASKDRDIANYQLKERIKELTTVKRVSELLNREEEILDDLLLKIVQLLPPGWQYPEITTARIVVGGIEFKTTNYVDPIHRQRAEFILPQGMKGIIEVGYTEDRPVEVEGPFLAEERNLIDMLAEMLRTFFAKRHESMALKSSEANLSSTINNTDTLIWSVDRNLILTAFNKAFHNYVKHRYGREVKVGSPIFLENEVNEMEVLAKKWGHLYQRALAGEKIAHEENRFGVDFQYSIGPIIEDDKRVTGVNVFATDVTVQKQRANELMEANKQIGELKLMALRSVMNPHFIFNVLNSIQFYIVANDRLNAVNYLSTFSKLIRSILTHSVHNKIKLEDEIEMLKNYTQLEMVRFENKFSFNLEVDPNLEIDTIEIPSLLVQPFVENAILHGLYNKQGTGVLTIRIKEDGDAIVFEIEDDGVGREAALKHKLNNPSAHKSMGVKLTEERLKLINENHNVSFKVDDLKNGDEACGTRASIWIRA